MKYYFHAIRKLDVIIAAEMIERVRPFDKNAEFSLLLTQYPQFDYSDINLKSKFDEILTLPFCGFFKNIFKGFKAARAHFRKLRGLNIPDGSAFFFFDDAEVSCFNVYKKIARERARGKKIKMFHLVYVVNPITYRMIDSVPDIPRSVLMSLYTAPLFGRFISARKLDASSLIYGVSAPAGIFDKEIFFHKKSPAEFHSEFDNIPMVFGNALPSAIAGKLPKRSVIFLPDTLKVFVKDRILWRKTLRKVLDALDKKFGADSIYVKMHPTDRPEDYDGTGIEKFKRLNGVPVVESYFAANGDNISAVFSIFSTANYASAAAWIPSFHLYPLLKLGDSVERYLSHFTLENHDYSRIIRDVGEISEIEPTRKKMADGESGKKEWRSLCEYITKSGG